MHHLDSMTNHLDDIIRHERRIRRSLLPFGLFMLVLAGVWLSFVRYV